MLNQAGVEQWLARLVQRLRSTFGERLVFVGHHGSWARGEPRPGSDIDIAVVVDRIESQDLATFRNIVGAMPEAGTLASGVFLYPFKESFYALQSWVLLRDGRFILTKDELINCLSGADDREVVRIARSWRELEQDREQRPLYYIELLERWSRDILLRL